MHMHVVGQTYGPGADFGRETAMKKATEYFTLFSLHLALAACSAGGVQTAPAATSAGQASTPTTETADVAATSVAPGAASVPAALAENSKVDEDAGDYTWDSAAVIPITLNGDSITADGKGVKVEGSNVTITAIGSYHLSGTLTDGQIVVDTADDGVVRLIFDGIDIRNSTSAPINIVKAQKTIIVLADDTANFVTDGASYVFENPEDDEPNAAIFSQGDLEKRTGLKIKRLAVGRLDFVRDTANLKIYYDASKQGDWLNAAEPVAVKDDDSDL